jgi:hypothetical protein
MRCPKCEWHLEFMNDGSFGAFCWNPTCSTLRVFAHEVPSRVDNLDKAARRKGENKVL